MKTKNVFRLLTFALVVMVVTGPIVYAQTNNTSSNGTSVNGTTGINYNESGSSSTINGTLNSGNVNSSGGLNNDGSGQTIGSTGVMETTATTPGVPNTGAGGESTTNLIVLFFSGVGMIVSIMLLQRKLVR